MAMDMQQNVGVTDAAMKSGLGFTPSKNLPYRSAARRDCLKCFAGLGVIHHQVDLARMAGCGCNAAPSQFLRRSNGQRVVPSRRVLSNDVVVPQQLARGFARFDLGSVAVLRHAPVGRPGACRAYRGLYIVRTPF